MKSLTGCLPFNLREISINFPDPQAPGPLTAWPLQGRICQAPTASVAASGGPKGLKVKTRMVQHSQFEGFWMSLIYSNLYYIYCMLFFFKRLYSACTLFWCLSAATSCSHALPYPQRLSKFRIAKWRLANDRRLCNRLRGWSRLTLCCLFWTPVT